MNIDDCAELVAQEWLQSDLDIEVDTVELGLYLAIVCDRQELENSGLGDVTSTRVSKNGSKPGITTPEVLSRGDKIIPKFVPPAREPTEDEKRLMVAIALKSLILASLKNHVFSFNGKIYHQTSGGAIGDRLVGVLGDILGSFWCRDFLDKLKKSEIVPKVNKLYIDDHSLVTNPVPLGARFKNDRVEIIEEEIENDRSIPADVRTSKILKEIGNSICPFIKVSVDCPSNHEDGFLPILDLKTRIVENKVEYRFYKKKLSNRMTIMASSALPPNVKRATMTNEVLRRLRNTKRGLSWSIFADTVSEFSNDMKNMGYSEGFRSKVIQAALTGYRRQCQLADTGARPLHRPRDYDRVNRRNKKLMSRDGAWLRPQHHLAAFYPATPDGWLVKGITKIMREEGQKIGLSIKVVEESGTSLGSLLTRPDLSGCLYPDCRMEDTGPSHLRAGANYSGVCTICSMRYRGETGFSAHARINSHEKQIKTNDQKNSMAQHLNNEHPTRRKNVETFSFEVLTAGERPLTRQIREAQKIANDIPSGQLINGRSEHIPPAFQQLAPTDILNRDQRRAGR